MAKYDPLRDYLRRQRAPEVVLTFRGIEAKIGYMLPNIAATHDWWACLAEPGPREVQKIAWRAAGFDAELLSEDRVRFSRRSTAPADP